MDVDNLSRRFREALPAGIEHCSLRWVDERTENLSVRRDVAEPPQRIRDVGLMVTVHDGGGMGYAATGDMSSAGIREAIERARTWAERTAGASVFDPRDVSMPVPHGTYETPVASPWNTLPVAERIDRIRRVGSSARVDDRIVEWSASVMSIDTDVVYLTSEGGDARQRLRHLSPEIEAIAHAEGLSQRRTLGGLRGASQQGGAEILDRLGFDTEGGRVGRQAIELIEAKDCPSGRMELLLAPDQMMLQIHESIGHPLELDRILGDERNYAGTSFVTLDMFGSYQYGSELLDVTFDPDIPEQFASYRFDDDGTPAERVHLIRKGLLVRPLGGVISQFRSGMQGVANSRASTWSRPPIDRMANLNVEPGDSSFEELVRRIEHGVFMETNLSWSIDDSRNKFQFGCEYGREIVNGELGDVVRNPNYRGISANFWRNLSGVGNRGTLQVLGTPYCGKGEPNQVVRVGHASPVCLFSDIAVFGGHQ
jgi:predicted Zn-dependent protease